MRFTIMIVSILTLTSYMCGTPHVDIVIIIACMGVYHWLQRRELEQTRLILTQHNESSSQKQARHEIARQSKWITQLCEQKHSLAAEIVTMEENHARKIHDIRIRYTRNKDTDCNSSTLSGNSMDSNP